MQICCEEHTVLYCSDVTLEKQTIQRHKVLPFLMKELLFGFREKKIDTNTFCFKFKSVSMDTALLLCDSASRTYVTDGGDLVHVLIPYGVTSSMFSVIIVLCRNNNKLQTHLHRTWTKTTQS